MLEPCCLSENRLNTLNPLSGAHGITIRPLLLEGLDSMKASLTLRRRRLELTVHRAASTGDRGGQVGSKQFPWTENGVRLPLLDSDLALEIEC